MKQGLRPLCGLTPAYHLTPVSRALNAVRHQFSINVASEWGADNVRFEGEKIDQDLWMLPVTAGYDINVGLTDTVFLDLGAKAGWATGNYKESGEFGSDKTHFNGFTMGVGAGLKFI